uniref:Uncharacterized protein n=1 Tax=Hyaloperonospora arabidopsidis (strain Emoy2) TaxID=559515 RepID=M4BQJ0_HYAAE
MEFLVHNISHSDLVVELSWLHSDTKDLISSTSTSANSNNHTTTDPLPSTHEARPSIEIDGISVPLSILARPKYSLFQQTSRRILDRVQQLQLEQPQASPSSWSSLLHTCNVTSDKRSTTCNTDTQLPIGFNLAAAPIDLSKSELLSDFQLRTEGDCIERYWDDRVGITAVYFPLVALLLPKWLQVLTEFQSETSRRLVYLISGAGIPRHVEHVGSGNSTEVTAQLLALFVHEYDRQVTVIQVHSGSNIFRFDDNVQFMTRELRPLLEAHRETLVDRCGEAWKAHFHVTIAYADGPPARLSALNASLRIYRPSYLHVWQLKTFWHEWKVSLMDVDFHSFENIEASPLIAPSKADAMTQRIVVEMKTFRDQFLAAEGQGELASFWLRKSRKPVLAVLLIEKAASRSNESPTVVVQRGMNCEVSMPTGSLCAERNAIGSALASDPTLTRRALKMIAVLGLNLAGGDIGSSDLVTGSTPLISTDQSEERVQEDGKTEEELLQVHTSAVTTFVEPTLVSGKSGSKTTADVEVAVEPDRIQWTVSGPRLSEDEGAKGLILNDECGQHCRASEGCGHGKRSREHVNEVTSRSLTKPKRPRTFSCDELISDSMRESRTLPDRNPLAPCGACKEWLVKIAEANPSFRVITFDNAHCRHVYINQII